MKIKELREKNKSELEKMLREMKSKLFELTINLSYGQVKNTSELRKTKKDIARVLTIFNS